MKSGGRSCREKRLGNTQGHERQADDETTLGFRDGLPSAPSARTTVDAERQKVSHKGNANQQPVTPAVVSTMGFQPILSDTFRVLISAASPVGGTAFSSNNSPRRVDSTRPCKRMNSETSECRRSSLIDQPRDELDNRFLWETVLSALRRLKGRRQVIVATHNANIVVNGDADLVVQLEADAQHGRVAVSGAIEAPQVRRAIIETVDGGEKASELRKAKYGF